MRKQNQKAYLSRLRSSRGQTTLQSFLFKPRVADGELNPPPPPPPPEDEDETPNSPPAPPKREIVRVTNKTIKEKASAFSSVGSSAKNGGGREAGDASALNAAVFRRFNGSTPPAARPECSADDDGGSGSGVRLDVEDIAAGSRRLNSRKRKSPLGACAFLAHLMLLHVVVLGDDPKPRPPPSTRRGRPAGRGRGDNGLYNHYASGGGLWQGEQEGVDGEEVGWTEDMWEGMGSISLGGMEWH
ncbi:uncharacterized protein LOC124705474 [Lolium rigidum]|uniref:uncharacterized protein LOC124705474 n=1 Tax=Lolium rigidum TaxID=89674 RepID=UPI001F5CD870|nr:uncharacterized protein LOC124705474 [Lolium rigidum]